MIKLKQLLTEKTVKLSTMKDANFEPGQFVQLMGKKGMVKLDKKSVHSLAKIVRQLSGKKGMGWSFTMGEGKLTEAETMKLSDVWKDYVKKYGKNKAAEKLMDILTMGAWASWDGDRIKRFKKEIIKKFSKFMKEGKLNEGPEFEKGDTVSLLSFDRRQKGKARVRGITKAKKNKFGIKHHYITNKGTFSDMEVVGTEAYKLRFKGNTEKKVMKAMGI